MPHSSLFQLIYHRLTLRIFWTILGLITYLSQWIHIPLWLGIQYTLIFILMAMFIFYFNLQRLYLIYKTRKRPWLYLLAIMTFIIAMLWLLDYGRMQYLVFNGDLVTVRLKSFFFIFTVLFASSSYAYFFEKYSKIRMKDLSVLG
ncbi:MAG: hypothetical protein ACI9FN_000237 [Saprospiraceae bacterium]|jgi:hypothetical protein